MEIPALTNKTDREILTALTQVSQYKTQYHLKSKGFNILKKDKVEASIGVSRKRILYVKGNCCENPSMLKSKL